MLPVAFCQTCCPQYFANIMLPAVFYHYQHHILSILSILPAIFISSILQAAFCKQHFITSIFVIPYCEHHLQAAFYHTSIFPVPLHQQHFASSILPSYFCYCCAIILQFLSALYQYFCKHYKHHFVRRTLQAAFIQQHISNGIYKQHILPAEC